MMISRFCSQDTLAEEGPGDDSHQSNLRCLSMMHKVLNPQSPPRRVGHTSAKSRSASGWHHSHPFEQRENAANSHVLAASCQNSAATADSMSVCSASTPTRNRSRLGHLRGLQVGDKFSYNAKYHEPPSALKVLEEAAAEPFGKLDILVDHREKGVQNLN